MKILFLHGLNSTVGGVKPIFLAQHGHTVLNPKLPDDDFDEAVRIAQEEYDRGKPDVVVGSSRGGAVAMNIKTGDTPLVLLCPAWKRWGTATTVKPNTVLLHSKADEVVPFTDSVELIENSGLPSSALIETGTEHQLADEESLKRMLEAAINACVPESVESEEELLQQKWGGLCYTAAIRWITVAKEQDWLLVHGTVFSQKLGRRTDHAWCERGGTIVDLTFPIGSRIIERERYYQAAKPETMTVYAAFEAFKLSMENGHDGPWDKSEAANHL